MPDDITGLRLLPLELVGWQPADPVDELTGPATLQAVLRALVAMASISRRYEADVASALFAAGLNLAPGQRDGALCRLRDAGSIERIIPLADGGVLVSVTAAGMSRASGRG